MDWATIIGGAGLLFFIYVLFELDRRVKTLEADNRILASRVDMLRGECIVLSQKLDEHHGISALRSSNMIGPNGP
jgi:hypothetical protein